MFLHLNHTKLEVYKASRKLLLECYKVSGLLPDEEKYNLKQQIKRAALSVKLNIAEGASRKSDIERKRYYEIARGSVIEVDAAIEACVDLCYLRLDQLEGLKKSIVDSFVLLTRIIKS